MALMELTESIRDRGLMHAPVIRNEAGELVLVAGERRMRAIKDLHDLGDTLRYNGQVIPEGSIPVVTLGELSILEAEEAELDENLKRTNLTWQEHAEAVKRLHDLRGRQAEAAALADLVRADGSAPADGPWPFPKHTVADTALEIHGRSDGSYQDTVRKEIIVAQNLHRPEIAKAKSADEAFKILKRSEEATRNRELAASVGATFSSAAHQIFNDDCLHWMGKPERAGVFDVIVTDPPYGMDADGFGDGAGRLSGIEHHYDDSYPHWKSLMFNWATASFRVTKPQAHAYVFCDIDRFHELKGFMVQAGWYVFRTPLINFKINSGRVPLPDRGPRRQYEIILYAIKGNMPVTHIYPDVIQTSADENLTHGAQKPVELYKNLLQRSVRPGMQVLDSFGGTGPLIDAAHEFKCYATVVEQNPEYYGLCLKRAKALKALEEPAMF